MDGFWTSSQDAKSGKCRKLVTTSRPFSFEDIDCNAKFPVVCQRYNVNDTQEEQHYNGNDTRGEECQNIFTRYQQQRLNDNRISELVNNICYTLLHHKVCTITHFHSIFHCVFTESIYRYRLTLPLRSVNISIQLWLKLLTSDDKQKWKGIGIGSRTNVGVF